MLSFVSWWRTEISTCATQSYLHSCALYSLNRISYSFSTPSLPSSQLVVIDFQTSQSFPSMEDSWAASSLSRTASSIHSFQGSPSPIPPPRDVGGSKKEPEHHENYQTSLTDLGLPETWLDASRQQRVNLDNTCSQALPQPHCRAEQCTHFLFHCLRNKILILIPRTLYPFSFRAVDLIPPKQKRVVALTFLRIQNPGSSIGSSIRATAAALVTISNAKSSHERRASYLEWNEEKSASEPAERSATSKSQEALMLFG